MEMSSREHSTDFSMRRVKFARTFGRMIEGSLYHPEKPYRLFIAYKVTHRVNGQKVTAQRLILDYFA